MIINLKKEDFNELLNKDLVLVDFYATWCGPCKMLGPILEDLAEEGYNIVKVDVDLHYELAKSYGIMSVPTMLVVKNGEVKNQLVGFASYEELKEVLDNN